MAATAAGVDGYDHLLDDLSPVGEDAALVVPLPRCSRLVLAKSQRSVEMSTCCEVWAVPDQQAEREIWIPTMTRHLTYLSRLLSRRL